MPLAYSNLKPTDAFVRFARRVYDSTPKMLTNDKGDALMSTYEEDAVVQALMMLCDTEDPLAMTVLTNILDTRNQLREQT